MPASNGDAAGRDGEGTGEGLPQGAVAFPAGADLVALAQIFDPDGNVTHSLNHIGKGLFHMPEIDQAPDQQEADHQGTRR